VARWLATADGPGNGAVTLCCFYKTSAAHQLLERRPAPNVKARRSQALNGMDNPRTWA
jgi:tRNA1(Val) A37 N6-methylase TrmN6